MGKTTASATALYYPHLQVSSGQLKAWLLYWDRVRRIVPGGYDWATADDEDARVAVKEEVLINTLPDQYVEAAATLFRNKAMPLLQPGANTFASRLMKDLDSEVSQRPFEIHIGKMSPGLASDLEQLEVTKLGRDQQWLRVPDMLGGLYMACLGASMADGIKSPLVTDNPEFNQCGEYLMFGDPVSESQPVTPRALLFKLGISLPGPEELAGVPMSRILVFRSRRKDEMDRFRTSVEAILSAVAEVKDRNELADYLARKRREIETAANDYRAALGEMATGMMSAVLKLTIPAGFATVANMTQSIDPIVAGFAGLSFATASIWAEVSAKRRKANKENPWRYASEVQGKFPKPR